MIKYTSAKAKTLFRKPKIAELCKGSTADSDSVCLGSNPSSAAIEKTTSHSGGRFFYPMATDLVRSNTVLEPCAFRAARAWVRIPHPKLDKLACQAKGDGIFAIGEYPSSCFDLSNFFIQVAGLAYHHRTTCGAYHQERQTALVSHHAPACIFLRLDDIHAYGVIWHDGLEISTILCYTDIRKEVGI